MYTQRCRGDDYIYSLYPTQGHVDSPGWEGELVFNVLGCERLGSGHREEQGTGRREDQHVDRVRHQAA